MDFIICKATITDINEVYKLICELEETELDKINFEKIYLKNLADENICYLLAIIENKIENSIENKIIAFVSVHIQYLLHHAGKVAEIQDLFVIQEDRNSGIGKILVEKAEIWAKEQGANDIEVSSNQRRLQAHKFYERENYIKSHFKFTKQFN
jgi:PhnO protein